MRSPFLPLVVLAVLISVPLSAAGQATTPTPATTRPPKAGAELPDQAVMAIQPSAMPRKPLTNVQIDLTITDQTGSGPLEKKTVTMIAASGTWGKIRASGVARPNDRTGNVPVGLNVDARPFVMPDGVVQVELTIGYNPLGTQAADSPATMRPTELNQSLTVVLQSGKPLIVSQAADPISDRKIIVEAKATVLK